MISKPTEKQLTWQDMELGVIIHWCADVYNTDFKDFKTPAVKTALSTEMINPYKLNTDDWIRAAYKLGAKYAVLVANHCTGFSIWPTKENDYCISATKWKNGNGDVIADFLASCKKYGIKPGLYYSTGCNGYYGINDEEKQDYFSEKYRDYVNHVENQLSEIWTNYGELFEIWFDGGIVPAEKGGPRVFELLKKYQPDAITFQGPSGYANNIRWIGNEDGIAPDNCRCACNIDECGEGRIGGNYYCPAESDFPNRRNEAFGGGWFHTENERQYVIPPEELFECYLNTVGHNTNMLLGMGIGKDGSFEDEDQFEAFGDLIKKEFGNEIPCNVKEENRDIFAEFSGRKIIKYIVVREDLTKGQTITDYDVFADGKLIYHGTNIGHKRIIKTDNLTAEKIRLRVNSSADKYKIRDMKFY